MEYRFHQRGIGAFMAVSGSAHRPRAIVVVLGDVGRSPRMQYHSLSLADSAGYEVDLVGFQGPEPFDAVVNNPHIHLRYIPSSPWMWLHRCRSFGPIALVFKALVQLICLIWTLLVSARWFGASAVLVQTPPAIPLFPVLWMLRCLGLGLFGPSVVIDWHNFAYTLMEGAVGEKTDVSPMRQRLIAFSKWMETSFASRVGDYHLCVSLAMKDVLIKAPWNLNRVPIVFYDRPPLHFRSQTKAEQKALVSRLLEEKEGSLAEMNGSDSHAAFWAERECEALRLLAEHREHTAVLITSTSWTADEDFSILLRALQKIDERIAAGELQSLPEKICMFITGKGPMRETYQRQIQDYAWKSGRIVISTIWLAADDYPRLLGCADLGISLHYSSSGVDLPMKVVDMFGAGVPVCAINYKTLSELVQHGKNGSVFSTDEQLAHQIQRLIADYPTCAMLKDMQQNLVDHFQPRRWSGEWDTNCLPLFDKIAGK